MQRSNMRDVACCGNLIAALIRLLWLLDPLGTRQVYPTHVAESVLMRLPQLLWFGSFSVVVLVWSYVFGATKSKLLQYHVLRVIVPAAFVRAPVAVMLLFVPVLQSTLRVGSLSSHCS